MSRFIEETFQKQHRPEERKEKLLAIYRSSVLTAEELVKKDIPKRPKILGEWLCEGDLGYIFAPRGRGKTWMAHLVADVIARGNGAELGSWKATGEPRTVLVVDGEMNLDSTKDREIALGSDRGGRLRFLHHDEIFLKSGESINLADGETQKAITELVLEIEAKVLVLDNLSSLFLGVKENDNDEWEKILPWLLDLRRRGITVIIIHHAGKDESRMRGMTRREDPAHWVIRLDKSIHGEPEDGARFLCSFTKIRNCPHKEAGSVEFYLQKNPSNPTRIDVSWAKVDSLAVFRSTLETLEEATCREIADDTGFSTSYVSKLAKRATIEGWCKKDTSTRRYHYVEPNKDHPF
jgi:hypothetical protein